MGYVVYNPTTRVIDRATRTQAEANAIAAADADLSADTVDRVLPNLFTPGGWFFSTSSEIIPQLPLSDVERLKAAARLCHQQLITWSHLLTEAAITHAASDAAIGHDILFYGHEGVNIVCRNVIDDAGTPVVLTIDQRITFCQQTAFGASNVTNPEEFFQHVDGVRGATWDRPVVWVNPQTGVRIEFDDIVTSNVDHLKGEDALNPAALAGGAWIDTITA